MLYFRIEANRGKGVRGKIQYDCLELFKFQIKRAQREKKRLLAKQMDTDSMGIVKSFSYSVNNLKPLSYVVYCQDVANIMRI